MMSFNEGRRRRLLAVLVPRGPKSRPISCRDRTFTRRGTMLDKSCHHYSTRGLRILRRTCTASLSGDFLTLLLIVGRVKPIEDAIHPDQMDSGLALIPMGIRRGRSLVVLHQVQGGRLRLLVVGSLRDKGHWVLYLLGPNQD